MANKMITLQYQLAKLNTDIAENKWHIDNVLYPLATNPLEYEKLVEIKSEFVRAERKIQTMIDTRNKQEAECANSY